MVFALMNNKIDQIIMEFMNCGDLLELVMVDRSKFGS